MKHLIFLITLFTFSYVFGQELNWSLKKERHTRWISEQNDSLIGFYRIKRNKKIKIKKKEVPVTILSKDIFWYEEQKYVPSIIIKNIKQKINHVYFIEPPKKSTKRFINFVKLVELNSHFFVIYSKNKEKSTSYFAYEVSVKGKNLHKKNIFLGENPFDINKIVEFTIHRTSKNKKFHILGYGQHDEKYKLNYSLFDYDGFSISSTIQIAKKEDKKSCVLHDIDNHGNLYFSIQDSIKHTHEFVGYDIEGKKMFNFLIDPELISKNDTVSNFQVLYNDNNSEVYLTGFIHSKTDLENPNINLFSGVFFLKIDLNTNKIVQSKLHYFTYKEALLCVGKKEIQRIKYAKFYGSFNDNPRNFMSQQIVIQFKHINISTNEIMISAQKVIQKNDNIRHNHEILLMRFDLNTFDCQINDIPRKMNLNSLVNRRSFYTTVINNSFYVIYNDDPQNANLEKVTKENLHTHGYADKNSIGCVKIDYQQTPKISYFEIPKEGDRNYLIVNNITTINNHLVIPSNRYLTQGWTHFLIMKF